MVHRDPQRSGQLQQSPELLPIGPCRTGPLLLGRAAAHPAEAGERGVGQ